MNDDGKTKAQLIKELEEMRQRIADSETERQQLKPTIHKINAQLSAMMKVFDGLIYVCSQGYSMEYMNENLIERTGYDGTGELCYKVLHDRDSICPWCVNDRVFKGETVRWEVKSPKDNRWYYCVNTPIYNWDGTISKQAMISDITARKESEETLRNAHNELEIRVRERTTELIKANKALEAEISERKRAEEALRESEETYRSILYASPDDITITDMEGHILMVSPASKKMFGYEPEDEASKDSHLLNFIVSEDQERAKSNIRLMCQGGYKGPNEYHGVRKDQSIFDIEINSGLIHGANGQPAKMVFIVRDITDRKQAEAALKESQQQFSDIINFLPDATSVIDKEGKVIAWNRAMEEMTGVKAEEMLGKDNYQHAIPFYGIPRPTLIDLALRFTEEGEKKYAFVKREGKVLLVETEVTVRGAPLTLWAKAGPLYDSRGNLVGAIESVRDITKLKQAQEALQNAHDELEIKVRERTAKLENTNKELESFAYSVSHDLRAPLRAIDGFSRMLITRIAEKLNNDEKRRFEVIRDSAQRMGLLIDDLLAFSRLGRQAMAFSVINMPELVNQVWEELLAANPDRNISLQMDTLPPAFGDITLIRQVLVNLLSNAIKFTSKKETALIEIGGQVEDSEIVYFVRDNGAGFDMNYAEKLFGVFQRLHSPDEYEGTGAGLAIVRRIIQRHSGRVRAEGAVDKGATFFFTLPNSQG